VLFLLPVFFALEIDKQLRKKAIIDAKRFERLRPMASKHTHQPQHFSDKNQNDRITTIRQTYPNAFKPWSQEDDVLLVSLFSSVKPIAIDELTVRFGRHAGSIKARLKKHFGDDSIIIK